MIARRRCMLMSIGHRFAVMSALLFPVAAGCGPQASSDSATKPTDIAPATPVASGISPSPVTATAETTTSGHSRTTLLATLLFCKAFAEAEKKHNLNSSLGLDDLGKSCEAVAFDLNNADLKDVLPEFIAWSGRYSDLLLEMSECCAHFANRNSPDRQSLRMIEAFLRGSQGDPLGVAIEESNAVQLQKQVTVSFEKRRLKLLFEFQRLFNSIAPGGASVQVNP